MSSRRLREIDTGDSGIRCFIVESTDPEERARARALGNARLAAAFKRILERRYPGVRWKVGDA